MVASFLKNDLQCMDSIYISGTPVERVCCYKLIGVIISQDLTWNRHADYILKKANSRIYALPTIKESWFNSTYIIFLKFIALWLRLVLNMHHPSVWSDLTQNLTNLIESVQKRALRIILPSLAYEDVLTRPV